MFLMYEEHLEIVMLLANQIGQWTVLWCYSCYL